jgi:hypothetical protein
VADRGSQPTRLRRYITESFRMHSLPDVPLMQVPPQPGFATATATTAEIRLFDDQKQPVGVLLPAPEVMRARDRIAELETNVELSAEALGERTSVRRDRVGPGGHRADRGQNLP